MATFTYTAKRALMSGHTAGTDYSVTIDLQQADYNPKATKRTNTALSGNTVTVLHRLEELVTIRTDYFSATTSPSEAAMREFLYSVSGGEPFTYNDGADHSAILEGEPKFSRSGLYQSASFTIRLLS